MDNLQAEAQQRATQGIRDSIDVVNKYVQAGPQGLSLLCFFSGLATSVIGSLGVIGKMIDMTILTDPFDFVLHAYLVCFGATAVLLESDAEMLSTVPVVGPLAVHLNKYQKFVNEYAHFLTKLQGRGAFYIFVGTLCITECMFCTLFIVGAANAGLGVLLILLSFGYTPDLSAEAVTKRVGTTYQNVVQNRV
ncbi:unnamed protein product [Amoebophrya sp. A25]|nr:unnamed protein product [Amoebophrya sp. A25]|eukprot:GSA25T00020717001.1